MLNQDNNERDKDSVFEEAQEDLTNSESKENRKTVLGSSGATSQPTKGVKVLSQRSPIWKHYTRTKENRDKCIFHHCKNTFLCPTKSGTWNLGYHLLTCKQYQAWEAGRAKNQTVNSEEGEVKNIIVSKALFREATKEKRVIGEMPEF